MDTEDGMETVVADMLRRGFVEIQEFGALKPGVRVRHSGQQWPDAYRLGTGSVERIFHKPDSSWEQKYGRPDVELIMKRDDGTRSMLADYHVRLTDSCGGGWVCTAAVHVEGCLSGDPLPDGVLVTPAGKLVVEW